MWFDKIGMPDKPKRGDMLASNRVPSRLIASRPGHQVGGVRARVGGGLHALRRGGEEGRQGRMMWIRSTVL